MPAPTEAAIQRAVLLEASRLGACLFRNQVGLYELADGRRLSSGLAIGSPDCVGWKTVTITPDMVGRRLAVFVGVEVKRPGWKLRPEQARFLAALEAAGAIAGVVTDLTQLRALLATTSCGCASRDTGVT